LNENDGLYIVRYDHEQTLSNQAIAYKSQKTGEIKTLGGWLLLEPIEESQENEVVNGIEVVKLKKVPTKKARFIEHNERTEWLDVKPGDVVVYKQGSDYEIEIDEKLYFRIRQDELMYVEEEA
jgi:co-chaperonin GroES (HSP10)